MAGKPLIVAVQGELGSNSELAAREYFEAGQIDILPCRSFEDLFAAVEAGRAGAAMAPVENSLAGSIHDVWDLFCENPSIPATGEIRLRVVHCLIGLPGATLADIRRVRSHPQALAQCGDYLCALDGVEVEAVYDTAGAVQIIKSEDCRREAAIASAQAAADHGMQILAEDLSAADNFTRFLVLGDGAASASAPREQVQTNVKNDTGEPASTLSPSRCWKRFDAANFFSHFCVEDVNLPFPGYELFHLFHLCTADSRLNVG